MDEAAEHPHLQARGTSSRSTECSSRRPRRGSAGPRRDPAPAGRPGEHTDEALTDWGFAAADVALLCVSGAVA